MVSRSAYSTPLIIHPRKIGGFCFSNALRSKSQVSNMNPFVNMPMIPYPKRKEKKVDLRISAFPCRDKATTSQDSTNRNNSRKPHHRKFRARKRGDRARTHTWNGRWPHWGQKWVRAFNCFNLRVLAGGTRDLVFHVIQRVRAGSGRIQVRADDAKWEKVAPKKIFVVFARW